MRKRSWALVATLLFLAGCASAPARPPVALAPAVDLGRLMGDWYVIAAIPTILEHGAHNPKETYRLDADGSVATSFAFNAGALDGPRRTFHSRGFVVPGTGNAVWGQQYVWPFKADYRIAYVSGNYEQVVIAREKRDHVWIMARTPTIADADFDRLQAFVAAQGYDPSRLQRMPHGAGG